MKPVSASNSLDILKICAITCVIVQHSCWKHKLPDYCYFYLIYMAVPMFMMISGYLLTHYIQKIYQKGKGLFLEYYHPKNFMPKLLNYFIPFLLVLLLECYIQDIEEPMKIVQLIPYGGIRAAGNYYIPVFFQLLFLFPFIYKLSDWPKSGSVIILVFLILFELIALKYQPAIQFYRLLFFKFLAPVWLGILSYRYKLSYKLIIPLALISLGYITMLKFGYFKYPIFRSWKMTSFLTSGYTLLLFHSGLKFLNKYQLPAFYNIGRMTWFIFLIQLLYFKSYKKVFIQNNLQVFIDLGICIIAGMTFYHTYRFMRLSLKKSFSFITKTIRS